VTGPLRHLVATSQPLTSLSALRTFALLVVPGRVDRELIDWRVRAPRPMRVLVKKILRKYGYPPDLQDAAVQVVLQ
jgi:type I restriction enzyme, R subunit